MHIQTEQGLLWGIKPLYGLSGRFHPRFDKLIANINSHDQLVERSNFRDYVMKLLSKTFAAFIVASTLLTAAGCASTSKHEGTGEYVDDSVITTKVKAMLFDEPNLRSGQINVETFKGVVQLSGFVSTQADINKAIAVARSVKGVDSVKNDMRLK